MTFHVMQLITVISIAYRLMNFCIILTRNLDLLERELDMIYYNFLALKT